MNIQAVKKVSNYALLGMTLEEIKEMITRDFSFEIAYRMRNGLVVTKIAEDPLNVAATYETEVFVFLSKKELEEYIRKHIDAHMSTFNINRL
jgi:hypothetical protein